MNIRYKFWLENDNNEYVIGAGTYTLLKLIDEHESIFKASEILKMSYRHAWGIINDLEDELPNKIVEKHRGGAKGGKTKLTDYGKDLIKKYEDAREIIEYGIKNPWKKPSVAVDAIILSNKKILFIKRKNAPFRDKYALPGGFVEYGEETESAIIREIKEETGITASKPQLMGIYSNPERDPRGHTISIVYLFSKIDGKIKAGDDASTVNWFSLNELPELAFDHKKIINDIISNNP